MTLRMADSTSVGSLPPGMDAYAGYLNGRWATWDALYKAFRPGTKPLLSIDVTGGFPEADCLDVEKGDASVADVAWWLDRAVALHPWPAVYVSVARAQAVIDAAGGRRFRLWTAHYGQGEHICNPGCGFGLDRGADGTQWIDHGGWDESVLLSDFFSRTANPQVAGQTSAPQPQRKPAKEKPVFIVETVDTKTQFLVFDTGKVAQLHSTAIGSGLTGPAQVPYISGAQADVDNIARGYTPA